MWLGQANLAIRTGAYDQAGGLLDACQQRRSEDVSVWRARLNWGIATSRIDVVQQAEARLVDRVLTPAERHRLSAWIASKQGKLELERRELELLIEVAPADLTAVDRLAQLADQNGQPARALDLHHQKAEIERFRARYKHLHERMQPSRDALEMARLAVRLGCPFEARGFLAVALADDPGRQDLRQELELLTRNQKADAERR